MAGFVKVTIGICGVIIALIFAVLFFDSRNIVQTQGTKIAWMESEVSSLRSEVSNLTSRINGEHRDLITCADLQQQNQLIDGIVAPQGYIGPIEFSSNGTVLSALPLPVHCINS